jgi:membrane protein DedA with SNARE-associated domain
MLENIVDFVLNTVEAWGYAGIFAMMFLESTFFPFPSEVAMVPAGYLAYQGKMNIFLAITAGAFGSLFGALLNYYLASTFGRKFLLKYGKYFFIKEETISKMEEFFKSHGHISTFTGRLIPGIRQYISLPAGLSKMDIKEFAIYTLLGAGIWVIILALIGYFVGANEELIHQYIKQITVAILMILAIFVFWYVKRGKKV